MSWDQSLARLAVARLHARMRQRKMFDRYPGTKCVVQPFGQMQDPPSHEDRLYIRDVISRGGFVQQIEHLPDTDALDEMLDYWAALQQRCFTLRCVTTGWGGPHAPILIVGDRYNGESPAQLPFSNRNGASRTLSQLLTYAKLREPQLFFMNAYFPNGNEDLSQHDLANIRPQRIVALGSNAAMRVEEIGVRSYARFPHPQYLGRFDHKSLETWGQRLRALVEDVLLD